MFGDQEDRRDVLYFISFPTIVKCERSTKLTQQHREREREQAGHHQWNPQFHSVTSVQHLPPSADMLGNTSFSVRKPGRHWVLAAEHLSRSVSFSLQCSLIPAGGLQLDACSKGQLSFIFFPTAFMILGVCWTCTTYSVHMYGTKELQNYLKTHVQCIETNNCIILGHFVMDSTTVRLQYSFIIGWV